MQHNPMLRQKAGCFFWYRPTRVVPEQRPLNGCCCCYYLSLAPSLGRLNLSCCPVIEGMLLARTAVYHATNDKAHQADL